MAKAKKNERTLTCVIHYSYPGGDASKRAYVLDLHDRQNNYPVRPEAILGIWKQVDGMMDVIIHRRHEVEDPTRSGFVLIEIGVDESWDWSQMAGNLRYYISCLTDSRDPEKITHTAFDGNAGALYAGIVAIAQLALNR